MVKRVISQFGVLRVIGVLGVLVVILFCGMVTTIALFLQSLSVLTGETVVAEVIMSPIESDESGDYIDIEFTPYIYQSAFSEIFQPATDADLQTIGQTQDYRIYGDTVGIEGPFIKLHEGLLFLNYSNIYKLSLIEGEYRLSENDDRVEGTEVMINGGYDASWWDFNAAVANAPYSMVVDRFTFEGAREPGFYGTGKRKYEIVATVDTFTWNLIATIKE